MSLVPLSGRALAAGLVAITLALGFLAAPADASGRLDGYRMPTPRSEVGRVGVQHAAWPADAEPGLLLVTATAGVAVESIIEGVEAAPAETQLAAQRLTERVARVRVAPGREAGLVPLLRAVPGVAAVEPVRRVHATRVPDDPDYPKQWAHEVTGAEAAWTMSTGRRQIRLAVVDSGVLGSHSDLAPNVAVQIDVSTGTPREVATGSNNDRCEGGYGHGHGTQVAGVAAAAGDNGRDVAGVAWSVSLIDVAVLSGLACSATDDVVLAGIQAAVDAGADIVNLSFGIPASACPTAYQTLIDDARAAGAVIVAAAGNAGGGTVSIPASCNGVISVSGTRLGGDIASYSATNRWVDLAGPGGHRDDGAAGRILSTSINGQTEYTEGTSFAAPYVAGLAALLQSGASRRLFPDEVEALLEDTAEDLGPPGRDPEYGWGLVRAGEAMALAQSADGPIPGPQPDPDFPVGEAGQVEPAPEPRLLRVAAGETTEAVTQAVAVSREVFADGGANHVVLARRDDFADALSGSALGFGVAPLLFTGSTGPLAESSRAELQRVLPPGGRVYLLGGTAALPQRLEGDLQALGYQPIRLAGSAREQTAVRVAEEVRRLLPELGFENLPIAILATRGNWPDAVAAGPLAAFFGIPVLLTSPDMLHPDTAAALRVFAPELLYGVGGTGVISDTTLGAARRAAGYPETVRLAGGERAATAVEVAKEIEIGLAANGRAPMMAIATNLRRGDGFAHVLSASVLAGAFGAVFVPVEADDGSVLPQVSREYATGLRIDGVLAGGADLLAEQTGEELLRLLKQ